MASMNQRILAALRPFKKQGLSKKELAKRLGLKKKQKDPFLKAIEELAAQSKLLERAGRLLPLEGQNLTEGEIVKVTGTFGFARPDGGEADVFLPGRMLMGAMPGDRVLLRLSPGSGELEEGEVLRILEQTDRPFAGVLSLDEGVYAVLPDYAMRWPLPVVKGGLGGAKPGDKVLAEIAYRGARHSEHTARILQSFGSSQKAASCCQAVLASCDIPIRFPDEVKEQARAIATAGGIHPRELQSRKDLREELIFTIDGADSKDLDDAISLKKTASGWELGVHIADVSHYVTMRSPLDEEALRRGTSVYYADSVIPMLPEELSNGICSLNPGEDRLAFSALLTLDTAGKMTGHRFVKSVIRSRVKGVYGELNRLLDSHLGKPLGEGHSAVWDTLVQMTGLDSLREKYADVWDTLLEMHELAALLMESRKTGGKMELESVEGKIIVDENGDPVDVLVRDRGFCERMIEEFMLLANEAAATFAQDRELPFVYRTHDAPSPDRLDSLYAVLDRLGVKYQKPSSTGLSAGLSKILDTVEGTPYAGVVNTLVLRSMAKAKYTADNTGHFGLSLERYAHFTSPIRRYPDLTIHRIMSSALDGLTRENARKRYGNFAASSAAQSTGREIAAMNAERDCEDCYKAQYMRGFVGEIFEGVISGCAAHGLYVRLPNTCEGLVRLADFPAGDWAFDGGIAFTNRLGGSALTLGDPVRIRVLGADVSAGQIDFVLA